MLDEVLLVPVVVLITVNGTFARPKYSWITLAMRAVAHACPEGYWGWFRTTSGSQPASGDVSGFASVSASPIA